MRICVRAYLDLIYRIEHLPLPFVQSIPQEMTPSAVQNFSGAGWNYSHNSLNLGLFYLSPLRRFLFLPD
jgi:hypothetical protein